MRELSLHILDIAQNSIAANAQTLRLAVIEDREKDRLIIHIKDDGRGMDEKTVKQVVDPFYTTRTTRKVGLGIPMFKAAAERCGGFFRITSQLGMGTEIDTEFQHSHIDRVPLGNMTETLIAIILADKALNVIYTHNVNGNKFRLNTWDIKKTLGTVPIDNVEVLIWLKAYISEGLQAIGAET